MQVFGPIASWAILLGAPLAAAVVLAQALLGMREPDPIWDTLWAILVIVFVHGTWCVWKDTENRL